MFVPTPKKHHQRRLQTSGLACRLHRLLLFDRPNICLLKSAPDTFEPNPISHPTPELLVWIGGLVVKRGGFPFPLYKCQSNSKPPIRGATAPHPGFGEVKHAVMFPGSKVGNRNFPTYRNFKLAGFPLASLLKQSENKHLRFIKTRFIYKPQM